MKAKLAAIALILIGATAGIISVMVMKKKATPPPPVEDVVAEPLTEEEIPVEAEDIYDEKAEEEARKLLLQKNIEQINLLESQGHYALARDLLIKFWEEFRDLDYIELWLTIDTTLLDSLSERITSRRLSTFREPDTASLGVDESDTAKKVSHILTLGIRKGIEAGIDSYRRTDRIKEITSQKIKTVRVEEAKKTLAEYEALRQSLTKHRSILKNALLEEGLGDDYHKALLEYYNQLSPLLQKASHERCDYLSYAVVSPYLARAQQLICLADTKQAVGVDSATLQEAAREMAKGCTKGTIMDASDDVRKQFLEVHRKLKNAAGKAELEELKVVQTLADSISGEKKLGAGRWLTSE